MSEQPRYIATVARELIKSCFEILLGAKFTLTTFFHADHADLVFGIGPEYKLNLKWILEPDSGGGLTYEACCETLHLDVHHGQVTARKIDDLRADMLLALERDAAAHPDRYERPRPPDQGRHTSLTSYVSVRGLRIENLDALAGADDDALLAHCHVLKPRTLADVCPGAYEERRAAEKARFNDLIAVIRASGRTAREIEDATGVSANFIYTMTNRRKFRWLRDNTWETLERAATFAKEHPMPDTNGFTPSALPPIVASTTKQETHMPELDTPAPRRRPGRKPRNPDAPARTRRPRKPKTAPAVETTTTSPATPAMDAARLLARLAAFAASNPNDAPAALRFVAHLLDAA